MPHCHLTYEIFVQLKHYTMYNGVHNICYITVCVFYVVINKEFVIVIANGLRLDLTYL